MRPKAFCLLSVMLATYSNAAAAQSQETYLTKAVRSALAAEMAEKIAAVASKVGFDATETTALAAGARDGSLKLSTRPEFNQVAGGVVAETSVGRVQFSSTFQLDAILRALSASSYDSFLHEFPTIRLEVKPTPPRDYKVVINGEDCPATESGLYRVPPGDTTVNVTRADKPACTWSGQIQSGKEQLVSCQF